MKMKKICWCISGVLLSVSLVACGNDATQTGNKSETSTPAVVEAPHADNSASQSVFSGKVMETMDAGGYTYVKLDDGAGNEVWAAGPKANVAVGDTISIQGGSVMVDFTSKTLNRTFKEIVFASGFSGGSSAPVAASGGSTFANALQGEGGGAAVAASSSLSAGSAGAVVPFVDLKIEKPASEHARTVGEIFAQSTDIDTKKVVVKGQVVKISRNIMGKNWIHLQDGTGDPKSNTHDLVVTTSGEAQKGAIITLEGVVAANKDFGSGYRYDVIVEEAVIVQ